VLRERERHDDEGGPGASEEGAPATDVASDRVVRCAACGHVVTASSARIEVDGAHEHRFVNPSGVLYRVRCFGEAPGCAGSGEWSTFFTWFAGFAWRIGVCGRCSVHLGWTFRSESGRDGFVALIADRVVEDAG
jgi:hypothetical protein